MAGFDQSSYVTVAERIAEFRDKHPEGSLQCVEWSIVDTQAGQFLVYRAAAYRTPNDLSPGHGMAWENVPGKTNFTRDSELQNAETSAWGRAIVAALAADTRKGGVASSDEVRRAQQNQSAGPASSAPLGPPGDVDSMKMPELAARLRDAGLDAGGTKADLQQRLREHLSNPAPETPAPPSGTGTPSPAPDAAGGDLGDLAGPQALVCAACHEPIPTNGDVAEDLAGVEDEDGVLRHRGCSE